MTAPTDIIRVFPRRTNATPTGPMSFVGPPPMYELPPAAEVHVSCTFTWDLQRSQWLQQQWSTRFSVVRLGGPALGDPGGEFEPGMYVKPGYTITSRGCPNRCGFCMVPKREGDLRTLRIRPGFNVLDNNLLACPPEHIDAVLAMLGREKQRPRFTGGLEARRLDVYWAGRIAKLKPRMVYVAYDRPGDRNPTRLAIAALRGAGVRQRSVGCYVLVGQAGDTPAAATQRLQWVFGAGATPFAMYYRPDGENRGRIPDAWYPTVHRWCRPARIYGGALADEAAATDKAGLFAAEGGRK